MFDRVPLLRERIRILRSPAFVSRPWPQTRQAIELTALTLLSTVLLAGAFAVWLTVFLVRQFGACAQQLVKRLWLQ